MIGDQFTEFGCIAYTVCHTFNLNKTESVLMSLVYIQNNDFIRGSLDFTRAVMTSDSQKQPTVYSRPN